MRIHNLYADENGETHFRDIDIEMSEIGPDGTTSKRLPATGFTFERRPPIGFSIGIPRRDVNTSSTWMRPTKSQPVTEKLASLGPVKSF